MVIATFAPVFGTESKASKGKTLCSCCKPIPLLQKTKRLPLLRLQTNFFAFFAVFQFLLLLLCSDYFLGQNIWFFRRTSWILDLDCLSKRMNDEVLLPDHLR